MNVQIRLPTPLRPFVGGQGVVVVRAATVGGALAELAARYPALRRHLHAEDGTLRSFVNVYVNEDDMRYLQGEATPIAEGDVLTIVPSIAGGAPSAGVEEAAGRPPSPAGPGGASADAAGEAGGVQAGDVEARGRRPGGHAEAGGGGPGGGFAPEEVLRYARHIVLPEVGWEGQRRLKSARVLLVGAGGLGSPLGLYLAAAGVGTIGLVDFDVVDESNLQRQVLYGASDVGRPKLEAAIDRLRDLNPRIELVPHPVRLTSENALELFEPYDIVVDGSDNFPTRYLVNDACILLGKPNVYGSIFRFEGQVSVFGAPDGPCYRCLFREPPPPGLVPSCAEGGVLGVLPGIIGTLQALETIKLILGRGDPLVGRLLLFDALALRWRELRLRRDPACPACGERRTITHLIDYEEFCGMRELQQDTTPELTPTEVKARLDRGEQLTIIDVREPHEWEIANLGPYGARLIPMGQIAGRLAELNPADEIVLVCRTGARSSRVLRRLSEAGFQRLWNLKGGIAAWADEIDPTLRKY